MALAIFPYIVLQPLIFILIELETAAINHRLIYELFTPTYFKDTTDMNKLGCWFCTFLMAIISPIASIYRLIYWIFHV